MTKKRCASQDRLFQEMSIILQKDGFKTGPSDDECMTVLFDGQPLCKIAGTGGIRYRESDIGTSDREDALHQVITEAKTISEYMSLMENAPALSASGLDQNYMLLADFNGVVLAGHPTRLGVQFVTWDWDYDGQGVSQGHYFSNSYVGAKKDFAVRSGLIQKQQMAPAN